MSNDTAASLVWLILASIFCSVSGFVGGIQSGKLEMQRSAIKAGHAYYSTSDDGSPVFTWKEAQP